MVTSVLAVAPLRISFVGGGTDIANFYSSNEGAVVSCAIRKYVFVHVKIHDGSFGERYRISYSQVEHVREIAHIRNDIVRSCLEFLDVKDPVQISTLSDLPTGTGMGSSSSFTTALLLALHKLKGEHPTKHQLAEEACHVEITMLKHPIGKQDQYAAAFGGLNLFRFRSDGRVSVEPISISEKQLGELLQRCRLFWTGVERSASKILEDQSHRIDANLNRLVTMASLAHEFKESLEKREQNWGELANLISKSFSLKKELSPLILTAKIQELINSLEFGAETSVKVLGAGGGGFILHFDGNQERLISTIPETLRSTTSFLPTIDYDGARIISIFE